MKATLILASAGLVLVFSAQVMAAVSGAAATFVRGVLPALFPMMILNGLSAGDGGGGLGVLLSFVSGSPASAQRLSMLCDRGWNGNRDALAAATGVMSPLFVLGAMSQRTGDRAGFWLVLLSHWLSALMLGGALWWKNRKTAKKEAAPKSARKEKSALLRLPGVIAGAGQALLAVCGAMMLFAGLSCLLHCVLKALFPGWVRENGRLLSVVWALLEIGSGAYAVLDAFPAPPLCLLCGLFSFGGCSIFLQNLLFLGDKIRPGRLLCYRALHGALGYMVCFALTKAFAIGASFP